MTGAWGEERCYWREKGRRERSLVGFCIWWLCCGWCGFFLRLLSFLSTSCSYLGPQNFLSLFWLSPMTEREKWTQLWNSSSPKAKVCKARKLSLRRDERACWAPPAYLRLNYQNHSKSGISSLNRGCAAAVFCLQWVGQSQWVGSPQVNQIFFGKESACCYSNWALPSINITASQPACHWAVKAVL